MSAKKQTQDDDASIHSDSEDEGSLAAEGYDSTTDTNDKTGHSSSKSEKEIAKEESRIIFWLRSLTLTALVVAAIGVCAAIWFLTSKAEYEEYENQFDGSASKVISSFEDIVSQKLTALGSLAVSFTSYARNQPGVEWPFVTINDFQERSLMTRENSNSLFTRIIPKVPFDKREEWERYSVENAGWLFEAQEYNRVHNIGFDRLLEDATVDENSTATAALDQPNNEDMAYGTIDFSSGIADKIFTFDATGTLVPDTKQDFYMPLWQEAPTFSRDLTNFNVQYYPDYTPYVLKTFETGEMSIGGIDTAVPGATDHPDLSTSYFALLLSINAGEKVWYDGQPMSSIFVPVFESFDKDDRDPVAVVFAVFQWAAYFEGLLPENAPGVIVVLENNCDGAFTYLVEGETAQFIGKGDLHDPVFDKMEQFVDFGAKAAKQESLSGLKLNQDICTYNLRIYPTQQLYNEYNTYMPIVITFSVAVVFLFTVIVFLGFNWVVERRQRIIHAQAAKTTAIVSSLFPEAVRDRLLGNDEEQGGFTSRKSRLNKFLDDGDALDDKPIADLFPNSTVFFADIAGFTAWSSTRDPAQVFILLQTIYQAFDVIAKRRKVFKVETIGDSYVAVCGLPNPDAKHFITISRFATDCLAKFRVLVKELEVKLGPDTGDLNLRIGLHSGPVTAGVLRGDRSRFQLFGDTVNSASRMESTGVPGKIQVSVETAKLLQEAGKEHWLREREDAVHAKGKGELKTFFLFLKNKAGSSVSSGCSDDVETSVHMLPPMNPNPTSDSLSTSLTPRYGPKVDTMRQDRLVDWIVEQLMRRLKMVLARHETRGLVAESDEKLVYRPPVGRTSLDEIVDVIPMPKYDSSASNTSKDMVVDPIVATLLKKLVATISVLYKDNPFHNFEHACHVAMAVDKFLTRIVAPEIDERDAQKLKNEKDLHSKLHDYTHGITSDPMVLFGIVFSALIHDADHRGCSNPQLGMEEPDMASMYNHKSIAEQNSVDVCWELLMQDEYAPLRKHIFKTQTEMMRFRQVMVNVVLATDIFDKEFNDLRKSRWNRAFNECQDDSDLRATIVIEHIIQASDVSHTMQHWHIYRKWNERLFLEMYTAFKQGRMAKNPADFWYAGEIGFFDNYVIPLAKKLEQCNVFGVSSDECLNYALQNRTEWEQRGQEVLANLVEKVESIEAGAERKVAAMNGEAEA